MGSFILFIAVLVIIYQLSNISRNTADALDKQVALQYEIVAVEKRMDELAELLSARQSEGELESAAMADADELVNINHATLKQLTTLPKIGRATAQKIAEARPFSKPEDLKLVQGINEDIFADLAEKITV
ncbi:hypothetical protein EUZ85_04880 [Hahella sp. KA22]|uniref:ComEA family DNA-binding protein n=1 Tax=Hahella sp. KA22 TaxID=1628392 RepID=UPI000FDD1960|nr:helix-hairpin-helix domain-containing protein [Hahella sp. KA22]AZZ90077.1 hypothetical protein ENC22_02330 [Hahella sp. KA22]QAY53447.1 hypothetical protein EUZ85_04880 [Hahella sp. KA22]